MLLGAVCGAACGAATDPELGTGPFGVPCDEKTEPCVPEGGIVWLFRGPCFGACPMYEVTVDWTGSVVYDGQHSVAVEGRKERQLDVDRVAGSSGTSTQRRFSNCATTTGRKRMAARSLCPIRRVCASGSTFPV